MSQATETIKCEYCNRLEPYSKVFTFTSPITLSQLIWAVCDDCSVKSIQR